MPFLLDPQFLPIAQAEQNGYREWIDTLARTPLSQVVYFVLALTLVRLAVSPILFKTVPHKRGAMYGLLRVVNEIVDAFVYAGIFVFLLIRPFMLQAFLIPSGSMWPTLYVGDFIVANKAVYRFSDPKHGDIVVFRPPVEAISDEHQIDSDGQVKVDFIKRCIGLPGDLIELKEGVMYRNGTKLDEPYVHYSNPGENEDTFVLKPENEIAQMTKASFKWVKWEGKLIPLNYTQDDANSFDPRGSLMERPYSVSPSFVIKDPDDQRKAMKLPAQPIPQGYYMMMGDHRNGSFDSRGWGLVKRDRIVGRSEFIWLPFPRWRMTR